MMRFTDRREAGRKLAEFLRDYQGKGRDVVVIALPRGGVIVGAEVAKALGIPLTLVTPRKVGHPLNPEYAIAAVSESGEVVANDEEVREVDPGWFEAQVSRERAEAHRRRTFYLAGRAAVSLKGKVAVLVDDGVATGLTVRAAIKEIRRQKPWQIMVAVPVVSHDVTEQLRKEVDAVLGLITPEHLAGAVGAYYDDFSPVEDEEVRAALEEVESDPMVKIPADSVLLEGELIVPEGAKGIIIFVHGSGSGRLSPRNFYAAQLFRKNGFGTLLFDLLTEEEDDVRHRFDINLLTERLLGATRWAKEGVAKDLPLGYFGASTGAAAALEAAALEPSLVQAVVSRGGRPDLVGPSLGSVQAPTLLVVGERDEEVLKLNRRALRKIVVNKKLKVIPGATHLFEEPGALLEVSRVAANWFGKHLHAEVPATR